jgi:hypothetical protein
MQVDFFAQGQHTSIENEMFGICEDSCKGRKSPAYINLDDESKWIAEVHNSSRKLVDFYALDGCVRWMLPNGNEAKVCDGMLSYDLQQNIVFVELKDRKTQNKYWRIKAEEQLKSTIDFFCNCHDTNNMCIKAYICNKQELFEAGQEEYLERFKDDTGVTLRVFREIDII